MGEAQVNFRVRAAWWLLVLTCGVGTVCAFALDPTIDRDSTFALAFLAYGAVGAVIAYRRPGNPIGWVFLLAGAIAGLGGVTETIAMEVPSPAQDVTSVQEWALWVQAWFWYPLLMLVTTFTVLLFPDGLPSRRWRPVLWAAIVSSAGITIAAMFGPTLPLATGDGSIDNPLSPFSTEQFGGDLEQQPLFLVLSITALAMGLAGVFSVVVRYRRSTGALRAQMKWFVLAISLLTAWIAFGLIIDATELGNEAWIDTAETFGLSLVMAAVPIACGIAITRHGLYEIDRIISRTLAYTSVTAMVIGIYAALVTTVTRLLPRSSSALIVTIATLCAAAAFQPLLHLVRGVIDRRFNRSRYDALATIDGFADTLRTTIETPAVSAHLSTAITRALEPRTYGVWIRN
ncbi:MAG: hypothetical protein ACJ73J_06590 [Actinomycetes bacterium]